MAQFANPALITTGKLEGPMRQRRMMGWWALAAFGLLKDFSELMLKAQTTGWLRTTWLLGRVCVAWWWCLWVPVSLVTMALIELSCGANTGGSLDSREPHGALWRRQSKGCKREKEGNCFSLPFWQIRSWSSEQGGLLGAVNCVGYIPLHPSQALLQITNTNTCKSHFTVTIGLKYFRAKFSFQRA